MLSRNLCKTECDRCGAEHVVLDEWPRSIRKDEARNYFEEYRTMQVANATCWDCDARYLAWCRPPTRGIHATWLDHGDGFYDLSYRSTFNDEPGDEDVPKPPVLVRLDALLDKVGNDQGPGYEDFEESRNLLAEKLGWIDELQ